jgi:glucose/arabinose dehydrogenase
MPRARRSRPSSWLAILLILAPLLLATPPQSALAATFPPGFADALVASLPRPTALAFTPDGRMLITTKDGRLFVKRGESAPRLALTLPNICTTVERGLAGLAIDPAFVDNNHIYLYYTREVDNACSITTTAANRLARFTLGDDDVARDEAILIDNIFNGRRGIHNAGDLNFGKDGYLYVSVGDGDNPSLAPQLSSLNGKILRIASDGSIPPTNPYQGAGTVPCATIGGTTSDQACQEIYARGLRNPFRFAFDPNASETRFFLNDVGQNTWEEINIGQVGADYGWPEREGHCANGSTIDCGAPPPGMTNPIYDYGRNTGCTSITGGAFVPNGVWPSQYNGGYLFSDYNCGRIFLLRQNGGAWAATDFVTGLGSSSAVDLTFGPYCGTQALYYITFQEGGQVRRLAHNPAQNCPPTAALTASPPYGPTPLTVNFNGSGSSDPNQGTTLTYLWNFGDGATATTTVPTISHTYTVADIYTATLRVRDNGNLTSNPVTVEIGAGNTPPVATITSPPAGTFYASGRDYTLQGVATDAEDGPLAGEQLSWTILLRHNAHTHPLLGPFTGSSLTFTAPFHEDGAVWLEARLTATDSDGFSTTTSLALQHFTDVPSTSAEFEAVEQLGSYGIVRGYGSAGCAALSLIYPCFVPGDTSLRAQMAALIVRAMGWSGEQPNNPFTDGGRLDAELWRSVAILAAHGVAQGYGDGRFGPNDIVSQLQVASFISRAMVSEGHWQPAQADDPAIYPDVPASTNQRLDLVTYVQNAGPLPDYPSDTAWAGWNDPATRGWFARALWQALEPILTTP